MSGGQRIELWRSHQAMQEKLVYFLMAAAGACIGFSLTQAKDLMMETAHTALAVSLLLWAISFWLGFRRMQLALGVIWANADLLKVQSGTHHMAGANPVLMNEAESIFREVISEQNDKANAFARWQVLMLILGVVAYVVWQILLMLHRS